MRDNRFAERGNGHFHDTFKVCFFEVKLKSERETNYKRKNRVFITTIAYLFLQISVHTLVRVFANISITLGQMCMCK